VRVPRGVQVRVLFWAQKQKEELTAMVSVPLLFYCYHPYYR